MRKRPILILCEVQGSYLIQFPIHIYHAAKYKEHSKGYDLALYRTFSGIKVYVFVRPPPQSSVSALETD